MKIVYHHLKKPKHKRQPERVENAARSPLDAFSEALHGYQPHSAASPRPATNHLPDPRLRLVTNRAAPTVADVQLAVNVLQHAHQSHLDWIRHFERFPDEERKVGRLVGSTDNHLALMQKYDHVLSVLRSLPQLVLHGGPGSGDFGHAGRPGEVGGSEPGGGGAHGGEHAAGEHGHGEHGHGEHSPIASMGMEVLHESSHVSDIIHALPKVVAHFGATESGKAATGEGIEHGLSALHEHAHAAAAHAESLHAAEGAHGAASGGEHGGHGGGEHGGGHNALGAFAEATGAILGAKVGEHIEKKLGIEEKTKQLYAKMKQEHGEMAPWLHAAATATSIALKTTLAHAVAGPLGTVVSHSPLAHLGEHILEAATEGLSGFTGFVVPGVSYAALLTMHGLGKLLNKTGITSTKTAQKAGALQKRIRGTKTMQQAHALLHGSEQHLKNLTSLRLLKEAKLLGKHGLGAGRTMFRATKSAVKGSASGAKSIWERLHVPPVPEQAHSYLGGAHMALPTTNARTVTGKLPEAFSDKNPAVEMVIDLLRYTIQALMKTPLWDRLNTPQGKQLVEGLLA